MFSNFPCFFPVFFTPTFRASRSPQNFLLTHRSPPLPFFITFPVSSTSITKQFAFSSLLLTSIHRFPTPDMSTKGFVDSVMGLFGKTKDPKEQIREMKRKMRGETNKINRQIMAVQRKEEQIKKEIKVEAKKGNKEACLILAKSLVQSRKAVEKMHVTTAQINSAMMGMDNQVAMMRMAGAIQSSNEVLQAMQKLVKVPEVMATMRELSKEMTKAGIIEEMIEDTMESLEPEGLEDEANEEVEKVLWEVTAGELGKAPAASAHSIADEDAGYRQQADELVAQLEAARQ
uniref:Charged multivesicular body protein 3 n=1 Tax=Panagrellus redivivus TaxID=6233 RepID=A0A7E4VWD6_PANRE